MRKFYLFFIIMLVFMSFGCNKQGYHTSSTDKYAPNSYEELKMMVEDIRIPLYKIDTSKITNMSHLFYSILPTDYTGIEKLGHI